MTIDLEKTEFRDFVHKCSTCGFCRAVCPRFDVLGWDSFSPRGMVSIASGLLSDDVEISEKLAERIYSCILDGVCEKTCPSDVKVTDIVSSLREHLFKNDLFLKDHKTLSKSIKNYDNPWMQPRYSRSKWAKGLKIKDIGKDHADVLYYVGCTTAYDPSLKNIAISTSNVFKKAKVDFGILGGKELCCGSTLLGIGDVEMFKACAKENVEVFNSLDVDLVVTSCAGCYSVFKNEYPNIGKMNFEVVSAVEYIDTLIKEGLLKLKGLPIKVTYHDPCHLGRYGSVYDAPRNILRAVPGIELEEMSRIKEESFCCGAGAGVKTVFSDISKSIAKKRIDEAKNTGSDALVSACPFCYQNMRNLIKMYDIIEIVDMAVL